MAAFLFAYDLHGVKDRSTYDSINNDILKVFDAVKVLNTTFYIKGSFTASSLCDALKKIINKYVSPDSYELMVVESNTYTGWLTQSKINELNAM